MERKQKYSEPAVTVCEVRPEAGMAISEFGERGKAGGDIILDDSDLDW